MKYLFIYTIQIFTEQADTAKAEVSLHYTTTFGNLSYHLGESTRMRRKTTSTSSLPPLLQTYYHNLMTINHVFTRVQKTYRQVKGCDKSRHRLTACHNYYHNVMDHKSCSDYTP